MKIEIVIKSVDQWQKLNVVGIHSLEPSIQKIFSLIEDAEKDSFETIYIYTKRGFWSRSNIFASMSTWNQLRRAYGENADVRAGQVCRRFGQCLGDGFTIYFRKGA